MDTSEKVIIDICYESNFDFLVTHTVFEKMQCKISEISTLATPGWKMEAPIEKFLGMKSDPNVMENHRIFYFTPYAGHPVWSVLSDQLPLLEKLCSFDMNYNERKPARIYTLRFRFSLLH